MSNGEVYITDDKFNKLFSIASHFKNKISNNDVTKRICIQLIHPSKQNIEGDFFIISDFNELNVNVWCKEI